MYRWTGRFINLSSITVNHLTNAHFSLLRCSFNWNRVVYFYERQSYYNVAGPQTGHLLMNTMAEFFRHENITYSPFSTDSARTNLTESLKEKVGLSYASKYNVLQRTSCNNIWQYVQRIAQCTARWNYLENACMNVKASNFIAKFETFLCNSSQDSKIQSIFTRINTPALEPMLLTQLFPSLVFFSSIFHYVPYRSSLFLALHSRPNKSNLQKSTFGASTGKRLFTSSFPLSTFPLTRLVK